MKISMCHYSYHRTWDKEKWSCNDLVAAVKGLGIEGIDFHVQLLRSREEAVGEIRGALEGSGLELSGLSMSNNFCIDGAEEYKKQIQTVIDWLPVAAELEAPVSRIFGGHLKSREDKDALAKARTMVLDGLAEVTKEAERLGVILALENHGGMPCLGEEQVEMIEAINSPNLRATIDVGNYMACYQDGHVGTKLAAPYASYVHFKDFHKRPDCNTTWGLPIEACVVGEGDVDHLACLKELKAAGYDGYVAIEYEGLEDEATGVPKSVEFTKEVIQKL